MAGPVKLWGVRSGGQDHPNLVLMLVVLIIVFDALTNFRGSDSNDRVRVGVVVGWPVEDLHTQDAFFELVGLTGQRSRNHKPQEPRISLAGME
jgi:hypothetical protein